jgi:hypothetical protein
MFAANLNAAALHSEFGGSFAQSFTCSVQLERIEKAQTALEQASREEKPLSPAAQQSPKPWEGRPEGEDEVQAALHERRTARVKLHAFLNAYKSGKHNSE